MQTKLKVFTQDTRDPIRLQVNQDLTGLAVSIRTRNLDTGTEVADTATIVGDPAAGVAERAWGEGERAAAGGLYFVEAIVTWPDNGGDRTYPGADEPPIIVQVLPRRTQAPA